jgi:diacylglycerol kinase (ATP)
VPTGTANDFARALGLPSDLDAACALAARPARRTRTVEVLRAGVHPFVNAAAVGLSVPAAQRAQAHKRRLGALAYAFGAVRAVLTAPPLACRIEVDGRELFGGRCWQAVVAGTGAFGGGSRVGAADPGDGLLDVVVLQAGRRAALVRHAWALRTGGPAGRPGVRHARGRSARFELPAGTRCNVDGELRRVEPACFEARGERVAVVTA